mgnify:CR=1 FL=1
MWILLLNAAATWFMTGLIWFVQIVHYPLFGGVGAERFAAYHAAHSLRTTWVVLPVMSLELLTAAGLVYGLPCTVAPSAAWLGLALVLLVWISTAMSQVPRHRRLAVHYEDATARALTAGNWVRTVAWSARAALVLGMLGAAAGGTPCPPAS